MTAIRLTARLSGALCLATGFISVFAQTTASTTNPVVVLSPFVVEASSDEGYRATQTMAGSRLKTDLRDVGAAISVVTSEFLEDTGARDAKDVLVYTTNTEVGGIGGNFAGDTDDFNRAIQSPERTTRVRGLGAADLARNFYLTDIPFDTYNTNRIEIQRGANATLFGLGSPAGIINNALIDAQFSNYGEVQARTDSYGSVRTSLRLNRELIDDKLAIFVAGLYEKRKYEQRPAYQRTERLYGAVKWQPLANTTITANYENGTIKANRPRPGPVMDFISPWYDYGRPIWNTAATSLSAPPVGRNNGLHGTTARVLFGPANFFFDPTSATPALGTQTLLNGATTAGKGSPISGSFLPLDLLALRYGINGPLVTNEQGNIVPVFGNDKAFMIQPSLLNTDVFNFRDILLDGPNSGQSADFNALNVTLQQLFLNGAAGIELAYDRQRYDTSNFSAFASVRDYALYLDFNRQLLDGRVNPNFGGIATYGLTEGNSSISDRDAARVTGFYNLDFAKITDNSRWATILGKTIFTGLFNRQKIHSENYAYADTADPIVAVLEPGVRTNGNLWNSGNYRALPITGLASGQTLVDLTKAQLPGIDIGGITARQPQASVGAFNFWNQNTQQWENTQIPIYTQFNRPDLAATSGRKSTNEIDSLAVIAQSYLFARNLVTTIGWRRDTANVFDAGSAPPNPAYFNQRSLITSPTWVIPSTPALSSRKDVWSQSAVLHAPRFITKHLPAGTDVSVHYSKSSNFQPLGRRIDIENNAIDPPTGETTEYGFTLSLFNEKLFLKTNWYETSQNNNSGAGVTSLTSLSRVLRQSLESIRSPQNAAFQVSDLPVPPAEFLEVMGFTYDYPNFTATENPSSQLSGSSDLVAKGVEIELAYNPMRGLSFLLNVGRQDASRSNTSPATARLMEEFVIPELINSPIANLVITSIPNAPTVREFTQNEIVNPFRLAQLQDGGPVTELKKWQVTFVTNYRFGPDAPRWFKGWGVGGALRWLDKSSIGYPVVYSSEFAAYIQDVKNPWYAPSDTKVDLWLNYSRKLSKRTEWLVQLNLRNVLNDDALIPIATQPDGSIARISVPEPFTWELSTTFKF